MLGAICFCFTFLVYFTPYNMPEWISSVSPVETFEIPFIGIFGGVLFMLSYYIQSKRIIGKSLKNYHVLGIFIFDSLFLSLCLTPFYEQTTDSYFTEIIEVAELVAPILLLWYVIGLSLLKIISPVASSFVNNIDPINTISSDISISIRDEQNQIQLTLNPRDLLFIEAADNYVVVHYMIDKEMNKKIIRNSLKKMEELFLSSYCLRCHRSYIVNLFQVKEMKKMNSVYMLQLYTTLVDIPISRSADKVIKAALTKTLQE